MVLTFDDGYRNHLTRALPVLEKRRVRATVFVATGPVVSRAPFWFDRLDYAIQMGVRTRQTRVVGGRTVTLDPSSRMTLAASFATLRTAAKAPVRDDRAMNDELFALADALERDSGRRLADVFDLDPWSAVLTVDEIGAGASALDFGSHTVDHLRVHRLDPESVRAQLSQSRQQVEAWSGHRCRFFCYPDGGVSAGAAALVHECGYAAAVSTQRGLNYRGDNLMTLCRIDLPSSGTAGELVAEVSGLKDWLLGVRRRLCGAPPPV
jgi:peptidoglycan/xylan/chitin deacetylase (PgdA/CDA1 family)